MKTKLMTLSSDSIIVPLLRYLIYGSICFNALSSKSQSTDFESEPTEFIQDVITKADYFLNNEMVDSLSNYTDTLFEKTLNNPSPHLNFYANVYKGKLHVMKNELLSAMPFFETACEISNFNDEILFKSGVYTDLSHVYNKNLGHTNKHLEVLLRVYNYLKEDDLHFLIKNRNLIALGDLFTENENYKQADVFLDKVLSNCKNTTHQNKQDVNLILGLAYNAKAFLKNSMQAYDKSLEYLLMAKENMRGVNSERDIEIVNSNIGAIRLRLNQFDRAKNIFMNNLGKTQFPIIVLEAKLNLAIIAFLEQNNSNPIPVDSLLDNQSASIYYKFEKLTHISEAYLSRERYQLALNTVNDCLGLLGDNMLKQKSVALNLKSKILEQMNLYEELIDNLKQVTLIKDSLNDKSADFQLNYLNTKLKLANSNKDLSEQNLKIKYLSETNQFKTILIVLSFVLVILIVVLTRVYLIKKKKETAKEMELIELEDHYRKKQVTDFALHLNEKNAILSELKQKIKSLDITNAIKNELYLFIQNKINSSNSKVELEKASNELNKDFYKTISSKHPKLNEKDKELLYLIRLNYSSKQICEVLNIEKVTVNNYRYRLRKKLNLQKGDNLTTYVHSL